MALHSRFIHEAGAIPHTKIFASATCASPLEMLHFVVRFVYSQAMHAIIPPLLTVLGIYVAIGLLFGIAFAFWGVKKIDPAAAESGIGFKLLIIPGSAVFWPLLAKRWIRQMPPPMERGAHRN